MSAVQTASGVFTLTFNEEERTQLLSFLEQALPEVLVEVHRTDSPDFREHIERKEAVLRSVIGKLREP